MFRKIRISVLCLLCSGALAAQTSGIKVHLTDKATGQALPFANVVVESGNKQVAGAPTDGDGYAELKPLDPGTYNLKAVYSGYKDYVLEGVVVNQDVLAHIEIPMISVADTSIKIDIVRYRTPLVSVDTRSGGIADSEDIHHMAANDINSVASTVPGVYSSDVGGDLNVRGGRTDATLYIIDGQKVTGDQNKGALPISLIDQISVITGGTPAKYGDATGGIVEVNTLSGADHFFGSVQGFTSNLFDSYHNNDLNWSVGGPLWSKKDSNKNKKTLIDFIFGGDYTYQRDQNPSFIQPTYVNPANLAQLEANPLTPEAGGIGFYSSADFITSSQMETQSWHLNDAGDILSLSGKLNFHVSDNVKITVGGSYQYQVGSDFNSTPYGGNVYNFQMFNYFENPQQTEITDRAFVRLTQKFNTPEGKDKNTLIKNAFYSIQAEYSHSYTQIDNGAFGSNYFDYGYVGQFYQYYARTYTTKDGSEGYAKYMTGYSDSLLTFKPSNLNSVEANYTKDVYNDLGASTINTFATVEENSGLVNGSSPSDIYSLWYNVGQPYNGYFKQDNNHFRFSADFSAEIANNSIDIGFEYEQNSINQYNLNATALWTLMRELANSQLLVAGLDTSKPILVGQGTLNTYNYNYLANTAGEPQFDKSLREKIYGTTNLTSAEQTSLIQPDNYAPGFYSLNMFSASDLLNSGNSLVGYYGYNYLGNLNSTNPSIDDFFNQRDANGNLTYPTAGYQPIYMAGYIQDHFDIKSIVFDIGLRVEQFNANQYELSDPYLLFPAYTAGSQPAKNLGPIPSDIGSSYVVYVNNYESPSAIVGYRNGNNWYDANGNLLSDPSIIASESSGQTIQPYLKNPNLTNPSQIGSDAFTSYSPQTEVLPRLNFSFPITDKANFFAHYDILSQRPPGVGYNIFQPTDYLFLNNFIGSSISNPALNPQRTTDYELGFTQVLNQAKSMALKISAFYRAMDDQVEAYRFFEAFPTTYIAYSNIDFGTVKGLSLSYDLRRIGNWSDVKFKAGYTLSFADGTGSGPNSGFNLAASGEPNLQIPQALSYDQRHTINANLDFHFSSGGNYDGPVWTTHSGKNVQILSNAGVNINFSAGSGTPYTQYAAAVQQGIGINSRDQLIGTVNGDNLPWQNRIDAKADKMFHLSIKSHPCEITIYIEATNLLNTENVLGIYNFTGSPTDDGFLESSLGKQYIANQVSPQAFIAQYQVQEKKPTNFSLPRQANLGLVFNF
jgi:TonB-dependent Receptor Plug Domain/Carboxypeptidase regulatory-like domain